MIKLAAFLRAVYRHRKGRQLAAGERMYQVSAAR
jgi:hypothetical protein